VKTTVMTTMNKSSMLGFDAMKEAKLTQKKVQARHSDYRD